MQVLTSIYVTIKGKRSLYLVRYRTDAYLSKRHTKRQFKKFAIATGLFTKDAHSSRALNRMLDITGYYNLLYYDWYMVLFKMTFLDQYRLFSKTGSRTLTN